MKLLQICLVLVLGIGLVLPAMAKESRAKDYGSVVVKRGDCLWKIAARKNVYGDPWKWPLLLGANLARISNPDRIEPGWRLSFPLRPTLVQMESALRFARD